MAKKIFDIDNYQGKYVMHVTTEEEAQRFCEYLHSQGRQWNSGVSYLIRTNFDSYTHHTCYWLSDGSYGSINCAQEMGQTILEFSDFDWDATFKADEPVKLKFTW